MCKRRREISHSSPSFSRAENESHVHLPQSPKTLDPSLSNSLSSSSLPLPTFLSSLFSLLASLSLAGRTTVGQPWARPEPRPGAVRAAAAPAALKAVAGSGSSYGSIGEGVLLDLYSRLLRSDFQLHLDLDYLIKVLLNI